MDLQVATKLGRKLLPKMFFLMGPAGVLGRWITAGVGVEWLHNVVMGVGQPSM